MASAMLSRRGRSRFRAFSVPYHHHHPSWRPLGAVGRRGYHSDEYDPAPGPFGALEGAILAASLRHVPDHGFTQTALARGARDAGYLDASINLFPRGVFDLIHYHLATQRRALATRAYPGESRDGMSKSGSETAVPARGQQMGVGAKVRGLVLARLMANRAIIHRWPEALAIMAQPTNVQTSLGELARLSDEIWYLAGDMSTDTSWYTKRASLSAIYASAELYMTQDRSPEFRETKEFLERRLDESGRLGAGMSSLGAWLNFTGHAFSNVLRSKGAMI